MTGWEYPLVVALAVVISVTAAGWKYLLTVVALAIALGFAGARWRYVLVTVMLVTWLAMHLLNYISDFADRLVDVFEVCWLALFFLALAAPFRRRWRELAVYVLAVGFTVLPFWAVLVVPERGINLPDRWLQEMGLRIYVSYLSASARQQELLAKCTFVEYTSEDGAKRKIGECGDPLRTASDFWLMVVYDPSGELALPTVERTIAWRLAVRKLPNGSAFISSERSGRIGGGDLYWILADVPVV